MASVALKTLWLNDALDLADAREFPLMSALQVTSAVQGEVRPRANGRQVFVRRAGIARTFTVTLRHCDREQIDWLDGKLGSLLLVRDDRGRKAYAVYREVPVDEIGHTGEGHVSLTLTEVSHSEAV